MANKGTIGILTGGGDAPGLNPAIRAAGTGGTHERYLVLDVDKYYNTERLRPKYESLLRQPLLVMTSEY